jgi:hypothetical protein
VKKPKKMRKVKKKEEVGEPVVKKIPKPEKPPKEGKPSVGQAKFKPRAEAPKPKIEKGIKRIFRRKAF